MKDIIWFIKSNKLIAAVYLLGFLFALVFCPSIQPTGVNESFLQVAILIKNFGWIVPPILFVVTAKLFAAEDRRFESITGK